MSCCCSLIINKCKSGIKLHSAGSIFTTNHSAPVTSGGRNLLGLLHSFISPSIFPPISHPLSVILHLKQPDWVPFYSITIYAYYLSFHYYLRSSLSPLLWVLFCCEHSQRPSLPVLCSFPISFPPLLLLERFDLNAELQLFSLTLAAGRLLDQGLLLFHL